MSLLIYSGLLYLIGISTVLIMKPNLMFAKDGSWKEFGLYNSEKHTWFPVWLFCIVWAIVSYGIVKFTIGASEPEEVPTRNMGKKNLKPGYYVLNQNALESEGVPRYVYIGEEPPA